MKKIYLILVLLISTLSYSQRIFKFAIMYDSKSKPIKQFTTKMSYWINKENKFFIEYEERILRYTINDEIPKETRNGVKYTQFNLMPDLKEERPLVIQVFEDKENGILMHSNDTIFYQLRERSFETKKN